jgi:hypothetical protein
MRRSVLLLNSRPGPLEKPEIKIFPASALCFFILPVRRFNRLYLRSRLSEKF